MGFKKMFKHLTTCFVSKYIESMALGASSKKKIYSFSPIFGISGTYIKDIPSHLHFEPTMHSMWIDLIENIGYI